MHLFTKRVTLFLTAILFTIFTACKKDSNNPNSETVTASIFGHVVDENGQGIYGATATAGGISAKTDLNGIFILKNVKLDKYHAFVKVSRLGYFDGSRTFIATANSTSNIKIKLIPKSLTSTFSAASGAMINVGSNASVAFPANAIKNADGSAYSGTVNVYATFLDPTDTNLEDKMPGDLIGLRTDNVENLLRSFGMMNIELEDPSGNKLNLATDKEATLNMTVPSSLQSAAPATISMWYFDTEAGLWKEEGSATLTGNKYIGNVKHFTWWNCDIPAAKAYISIRIVDEGGNPISNIPIHLTNTSNYDSRTSATDNDGRISGIVYANAVLKMETTDNCGDHFFIKNIGPFAPNNINNRTINITDLGNIIINNSYFSSSIKHATYTGRAIGCNSTITNGYLQYFYNGVTRYEPLTSNGEFNLSLFYCSNNTIIDIIGYDYLNSKQSIKQSITLTEGNHDLGTITACSELDFQFIQFQITGENFISFNSIKSGNGTGYYFYDSILPNNIIKLKAIATFWLGGPYIFEFSFKKDNNSGFYPINDIISHQNNFASVTSTNNIHQPTGVNTTVTKFANSIGEYYEGGFSGNYYRHSISGGGFLPYTDTTTNNYITCTFRIKRTQ